MKILIVEDDIKISSLLYKSFKEENYAVDCCYDGEDALYIAFENSYDLIILDIMIPSIDGITLCKSLRKKGLKTPIIMLTAKSSIEDKVIGLNIGANDYISKPFSLDELIARVRVQLRNDKNLTNIYEIADLELDSDKKTTSRAGKNIKLSSKEFMLLEYFLINKESVVTEDMINNSLWDMDQNTASNIIKVYIYRLRTKVDKEHDVKLIHTVRGMGYKISVE